MDFIVANLPIIICAVVGIILLVIEMFMPGFGLPGIAGLIMLFASIVLTWMEHGAYAGLGATLVVIALAAIVVSISLKSATSGRLSRSALILKDEMQAPAEIESLEGLIGLTGITQTVLRPAGIVAIGDKRVNAVSRGDFIDQGVSITVSEVEGARVVVQRQEVAAV